MITVPPQAAAPDSLGTGLDPGVGLEISVFILTAGDGTSAAASVVSELTAPDSLMGISGSGSSLIFSGGSSLPDREETGDVAVPFFRTSGDCSLSGSGGEWTDCVIMGIGDVVCMMACCWRLGSPSAKYPHKLHFRRPEDELWFTAEFADLTVGSVFTRGNRSTLDPGWQIM